jgi:DNA-binding response OmpR family regulator
MDAPLRILVVDDRHDAADSMAMLLGITGHEVDVAYDGQGLPGEGFGGTV